MKHEIINRIIKEVEAVSYLEIGYGDGTNFNKIECENKLGVDPSVTGINIISEDSDNFFEKNDMDYDVIFIDGNHTADQVRKDIANSLRCNAKAIIIHDTIPTSFEMTEVPRKTKSWTGDVYKAVVGFRLKYPDVLMVTYRSDWGLSVIYPNGFKTRAYFDNIDLTYEDFKENEVELLNIID